MRRQTLLAFMVIAAGATAAPAQVPTPPGPPPAEPDPWTTGFRPLPFHHIAQSVTNRYHGRLVAAEAMPPTEDERDLGADLVYEFRLVTPSRHVLNIRVDARSGRFLEVAGRGQIEARRTHPQPEAQGRRPFRSP